MKKFLLLFASILTGYFINAQSTATGPYTVGTLANGTVTGTYSWTTNSFTAPIIASTGVVPAGGMTKGLNFTNFKFSVPATATIVGVKVELALYDGFSKDTITRLLIGDVETGLNLGGTASVLSSCGSPNSKKFSYGSSTNMWNISTITPAQVNASTFGFTFYEKNAGTASAIFGILNCTSYPSINIYYVDFSGIVESQTSSPQLFSNGKYLYMNDLVNENGLLEVYNLIGEKVYTVNLEKNQKQLDLNTLNTGVYVYKLKLGSKEVCKKFVLE